MNLRREPALLYMGLVAPFAQLLLMFFTELPEGWHVLVDAVIPAAAGLVAAALVKSDKLVPAILGVAQSVLACVISFGIFLSVDQQSALLAFVSLVVSVVIRDRVLAPVTPTGAPQEVEPAVVGHDHI